MPPQIVERKADATTRHLRLDERTRRAQHDEILKREPVFTPRAARRFHEADLDEPANRPTGQAQDSLDVLHAVCLHRTSGDGRRVRLLPRFLLRSSWRGLLL